MRKPIQWKNSRTSSFENKVEMQDITRKVQGHELRGQDNLEWNTELIEAMELEHVMSQAAQDLNDGEDTPRILESSSSRTRITT